MFKKKQREQEEFQAERNDYTINEEVRILHKMTIK